MRYDHDAFLVHDSLVQLETGRTGRNSLALAGLQEVISMAVGSSTMHLLRQSPTLSTYRSKRF